jgi:TetR/AcrR family transcriptional regulator, regulator of cefoperazone and chloramphenicol sensitivity
VRSAVTASDLTARARIRDAALELFGRDGFAGASVRSIAAAAGVSPALIIHHYGSKEELRDAVDDWLAGAFEERLHQVPADLPPDEISFAWAEQFAEVIGPNPALRAYLRRALLEGSETGAVLVDRLFELTAEGLARLEEAGALRPVAHPRWRPYQVLWMIAGPLLFEPLLARHLDEPFAPEVVRERSAASHDLISHGMLRPAAPPRRKRGKGR